MGDRQSGCRELRGNVKSKVQRVLAGLLYALPVIFFFVCYFFMTVWAEDIVQGANTTPNVWNDMIEVFRINSRLADMYAWAVINFFDYQYSFGADTIFRLVDVMMAVGMLYLITLAILGRRPKLNLKDAAIFGLTFLTIFLTPHGYTLYRGFSAIHNYLIISLSTLAFALPFIYRVAGREVPKIYKIWPVALIVGLVFGMSSNITPIAFGISLILIAGWQTWRKHREAIKEQKQMKRTWVSSIEKWQIAMVGGMIITLGIAYIFGPGVSSYANDPVYTEGCDYVAFGQIATDFWESLGRMLKHFAINMARTFGPIGVIVILMGGVAYFLAKMRHKTLKLWPQETGVQNLIIVLLVFAVIYLGISSQIIMPGRLYLPAYLGLVIIAGILFREWWLKMDLISNSLVGVVMAIAMLGMIGVRMYFALDYRAQIGPVLEKIRTSETEIVCVNPEEIRMKRLLFVNLGQDETLSEWIMPATVYGKTVVVCER